MSKHYEWMDYDDYGVPGVVLPTRCAWPNPVFENALELFRNTDYWVNAKREPIDFRRISDEYLENIRAFIAERVDWLADQIHACLDTAWPYQSRITDPVMFVATSPLARALIEESTRRALVRLRYALDTPARTSYHSTEWPTIR